MEAWKASQQLTLVKLLRRSALYKKPALALLGDPADLMQGNDDIRSTLRLTSPKQIVLPLLFFFLANLK